MEGRKNKAYYNTGTYTVPVWSELKRISGLKRPQSRATSEYHYRGAANKKTATGYKAYEITFKYETKADPAGTDAVLAALQASFDAETLMDCAFTDQAIATVGAKGVRGPFVVTQLDRDEDDENNTSYDVTLKEVDHDESDVLVEVAPYTTPA